MIQSFGVCIMVYEWNNLPSWVVEAEDLDSLSTTWISTGPPVSIYHHSHHVPSNDDHKWVDNYRQYLLAIHHNYYYDSILK